MMERNSALWIALVIAAFAGAGCGKSREAEAAFRNAEWLETMGRYREAIAQYETVMARAPRGDLAVVARMRIGEIYHRRLMEYDSARKTYETVGRLYPGTVQARDAEGSIEEIEKILRIRTEALLEGDGLFERGWYREALERYRVARSLDPHDRSIAEKMESAQERFDVKRESDAAAATEKGDVYLSEGRYEEAIEEYAAARELAPENEEIWQKVEIAMARFAPVKRERAFEKALAGGKPLDLDDTAAVSSLLRGLPAAGGEGEAGEAARSSVEGDLYWTSFSMNLPEYNHYFQGYELVWRPGSTWASVRFLPGEYGFPFLNVQMMELEGFQALCVGGGEAGARPCLKGVALFRVLGREEGGSVSAELVDARLEVPGRGFIYVAAKEAE